MYSSIQKNKAHVWLQDDDPRVEVMTEHDFLPLCSPQVFGVEVPKNNMYFSSHYFDLFEAQRLYCLYLIKETDSLGIVLLAKKF